MRKAWYEAGSDAWRSIRGLVRSLRSERRAARERLSAPLVEPGDPDGTIPVAARDFFGHPRGLTVLFATETWERFSYFGNAALVVLYMVKYLLDPDRIETVLGFGEVKAALELLFGKLDPQPFASQLFGFYTGLAYFTPILGGLIADRLLGQRRTVIIGGVLMAIGHFMMAFEALFLLALLAPDPRHRRVQAEHLDPGRRPLRAGRPPARPRLFDLLCRHQYRRVRWRRSSAARSPFNTAGTTASPPPASAC